MKKLIFTPTLAVTALLITLPAFGDAVGCVPNRSPLARTAFMALPLGSIKPTGWLRGQLELQKGGLTGHAEAIYPELGPDSAWLGKGGKAPDSDWERPSYYVRGLVPLAFSLDDAELKAKAKKWIEGAINSQRPDGSFGPTGNGDWWGRMPMISAIEDYQEATGDKRIVGFLTKYFDYQDKNTPDGLGYWGAARAGDDIEAIVWLYNRTGDKRLLPLMDKIRKMTEDWTTALLTGSMGDNHGVNVAEGFKMPPVWYQRSLDAKDKEAFMAGHENAMRQHGQVHDLPSCTEFMAGKSSLQGVEFCSIVDRIWSDGIAMTILGDAKIGDITEKIAFNALPGGTSRNMHQHQYYIVPNQAQNVFGPKGIYGQDYENALCPSTRSGVPCCCFNWHMGWPRFVQYTWAATPERGLAVLAYAPTTVKAKVGPGVDIRFAEQTNYPFDEQIKLVFSSAKRVKFPLKLRIPEWCRKATIKVNGKAAGKPTPMTFYTIDRIWAKGDTVALNFPMEIKTTDQINGSVAVERGPLVYSLKMNENWVKRVPMTVDGMDFSEYEVKPTNAWNYGLLIDKANPAASIKVSKRPMPADPFVSSDSPITLGVEAVKVPNWQMAKNGLPEEVPQSPVSPSGAKETITLVPFGSENLRITYFPVASNVSVQRGLTGEYSDSSSPDKPKVTRNDLTVDFHWGTGSPEPNIQADNYLVKWTGQIKPRYSGKYRFRLTADGEATLLIDGKTAVRHATSAPIYPMPDVEAGKWYDIELTYCKTKDMGGIALDWESDKQSREIVPSTCLRPKEASDLEAQFRFDETSGDVAYDSSGNGRDARLIGGVPRSEGKKGQCVSIAEGKSISIPDMPACKSLTIAAWIDLAALPRTVVPIVSGQETPAVCIQQDGCIVFSPQGSMENRMPGSAIRLGSRPWFGTSDIGKWRHVAVVFDAEGKTASVFVDGLLDRTVPCSYTGQVKLTGLALGAGIAEHGSFDGKIDDLRIYSRDLGDKEIAALASPMPSTGLRMESYADSTFGKMVSACLVPGVSYVSDGPNNGQPQVCTRFVGQVRPLYSEDYTFHLTSTGSARLWIDGKQVIDSWTEHNGRTDTATLNLTAGVSHDIKLEHRGKPGNASASLAWSSASEPKDVIPSYCLRPPADAPMPTIAWYNFSETSTRGITDFSGHGNDASTSGTVLWRGGTPLPSLEFANGGHIRLPEGILKDCKDVTVAAWVRLKSNRGWTRLFDFGDGPMVNMFLSTSAGPGIRFAITKTRTRGEQRIDAPVRLPLEVWTHIAFTLSGSTGIIYANGVEVARSSAISINPSMMGPTKQNYIGRSNYNVDPMLDGQIADFRIYNWALAPENIAAL